MDQIASHKHHFVYKTTCLVTGRYYIGVHSTDDMDDGYLGSGLHLARSLKKHGKDNHVREIIVECPTRASAFHEERCQVTEARLLDPLCMNQCLGGRCVEMTDEIRQKISQARIGSTQTDGGKRKISLALKGRVRSEQFCEKQRAKRATAETRKRMSEARKAYWAQKKPSIEEHKKNLPRFGMLGKKHSPETRKKLREARQRWLQEQQKLKLK